MKKIFLMLILVIISSSVIAGEDIGFGTIKGIKIGNNNNDEIAIYLNDGHTLNGRNCNGIIIVRSSDMSSNRYQQITSVVLAAYLGEQKIRLHSHLASGCNATFVALQEENF